jgi:Galactokinase galactose-binding signature
MTRTWFAEQYGREPDGIWFAPGRVNLMGGPDYTEGFVLPFALGAGVTAAAARRSDRRIALVSRQAGGDPVRLDLDALEPGSVAASAAAWSRSPPRSAPRRSGPRSPTGSPAATGPRRATGTRCPPAAPARWPRTGSDRSTTARSGSLKI